MKLTDILNENLGSFVYTKQTIKTLTQTLSSNKLTLEQFYSGNKEYYVLRTSPSRKDLIESTDKAIAILQLNGDKLNAQIKPKNVEVYLNDKNKSVGNELYTDEKYIKDISKFIEQISILIHDNEIIPVTELKEIESLCKDLNIPLFFYKDIKDFQNNNRQNTIKLDNPDYNYNKKHLAAMPESVKAFIYFYKNNDLNAVPTKYAKYVNDFLLDSKRNDFVKTLKRDLKGIGKNPLGNEVMAQLFKKEDTENIEKLVKDLSIKWKSIINQRKKI